MKRYIVSLLLIAGLSAAIAQAIKGTGQFSTVNSTAATPAQFTNATVLCMEVTILGKSAPRVDNTGDIYVGPTSSNDTQAFKIAPGGEVVIKVTSGFINLAGWYVDVTTANDGVTVIYR
jgi:hypothetical protein